MATSSAIEFALPNTGPGSTQSNRHPLLGHKRRNCGILESRPCPHASAADIPQLGSINWAPGHSCRGGGGQILPTAVARDGNPARPAPQSGNCWVRAKQWAHSIGLQPVCGRRPATGCVQPFDEPAPLLNTLKLDRSSQARHAIINCLPSKLPSDDSQARLDVPSSDGTSVLGTRLRRNRLVAIIAAVTLIVALGAYSAHGFLDRVHDNGHCDLCLHFSGTAGSPAQASVVGKPVLVVRAPVEHPSIILCARRRVGTQLPRAPPVALELT